MSTNRVRGVGVVVGVACGLFAGATPARAADAETESLARPTWTNEITLRTPLDEPPEAPAAPRFGAEGHWWFSAGAGVADNFNSATDFAIHLGASYFIADDVEIAAELALWRYDLADDSTFGVNPNLVFRWHFVNERTYTLYADIGIGLVFSADDVPDDGTSVNFTPRAGVGMTFLLDESRGWRGQVGVRWAHISNARLQGDDDNPSRDSIMVYAGIIIPF
jgi:hypothetical protein